MITRLIRSCRRGTLIPGIRARASETWDHWRCNIIVRQKRRKFEGWLAELRSRPPNVLIGANFDRHGGVGNHIKSIRRYSSLRIEPAPSDNLMDTLQIYDFETELRQSFLDFSPDGIGALHSHVFPWFIEWCKKQQGSGFRWIHTYHLNYFPEHASNDLLPWQKEINQSLLNVARHADVRISVARWQQEYLSKSHGIETIYIPNGVDVSLCDKADAKRFQSKVGDGRFVLYVGRNDPVKNPGDFARLAQRLPREKFVMIGHGLTRELARDEWGFEPVENLIILGSASHMEVQDAIAACSALVVTSKREGLPTLVLEALAQSKSVVVPNEAGCTEAIEGGAFGFIYRQGDLDDLVEKTVSALADGQANQRGRQRVLSEYDWRVVAPKLDALYRENVRCSK